MGLKCFFGHKWKTLATGKVPAIKRTIFNREGYEVELRILVEECSRCKKKRA